MLSTLSILLVMNTMLSNFRLDWEGAVKRGVSVFKKLEEDRLGQLCGMSELYYTIMENNRPKLVNLTDRLREPIKVCDVGRDVEVGEISVKIF